MLGIWHQSKWTRRLLAVAVGVAAFAAQPYRPIVFMGHSMEPTYEDHAFALAVRLDRPLEHGDVVVVNTPNGRLVKRVAFLEGDPIQQVVMGGSWTENLTPRMIPTTYKRLKTRMISVPKGFIYVLGDNVANSTDSRELGFIPMSSVTEVLLNPKPNASGAGMICTLSHAIQARGVPSKLSGKNVRIAQL